MILFDARDLRLSLSKSRNVREANPELVSRSFNSTPTIKMAPDTVLATGYNLGAWWHSGYSVCHHDSESWVAWFRICSLTYLQGWPPVLFSGYPCVCVCACVALYINIHCHCHC